MGRLKAIRTEADHKAALARIDALMDARPGTPEGDELDVLADLVEHYEERREPMGYPSAVAAIEFRMEQAGLSPRDLVPFLGSRAKVSEVLSGKRQLTMQMARGLHEHLGIPADVLLQKPGASVEEPFEGIEWSRFPLLAMAKLGWIKPGRDLAGRAQAIMSDLIRRAGGAEIAGAVLYRKNDFARANAKSDPYALKAWCWQVLATANARRLPVRYKPGTVTLDFLRQAARLSWSDDGPKLAREYVEKHGIAVVVIPHLPHTYLDGAALRLADGAPVVGLTLRYDRIDNFWFCLLHELAHVGRHMSADDDASFVDDLTLRGIEGGLGDRKEAEADEWAEEALIPAAIWETSTVRNHPTPMAVVNFARNFQVHPAIVAGRIRHEKKNYRLLSHFVGTGEVRRQFELATNSAHA